MSVESDRTSCRRKKRRTQDWERISLQDTRSAAMHKRMLLGPKDQFRLCRDMMHMRTTHLPAHRLSWRNENLAFRVNITSLLPLENPVSTWLDIATRERDSRMIQKPLSPLVETTPGVWCEKGWTHSLRDFMKTVVV